MSMTSSTHRPTVCIPEDIIMSEILVRLPVKTLLRFKSVRKSWYALINSSDFIHHHLVHIEDSNNPKLGTFVFEIDKKLEHTHINRITQFLMVSGENSFNMVQNLRVGHPLENSFATVAGSCHGVLCFYDLDIKQQGIVLSNPATRKSRLLPKPLEKNSNFRTWFVAFGFDAETSDYKVLCAKFFVHAPPEIQIYKRSTDSWRWIDSEFSSAQCCILDGKKQGRYLNGKYFCMGTQFYVQKIVSFDFNKEVFRPIPVPGGYCLCSPDVIQLDTIGDKLACITESNCLKTFEVWVLNDFSAKEEWIILHKISAPSEFFGQVPMAISRNREFVFVSFCQNTKLSRFASGEVEDWDIGRNIMLRKTDVYKESLVSVDAYGSVAGLPRINRDKVGSLNLQLCLYHEPLVPLTASILKSSDSTGF